MKTPRPAALIMVAVAIAIAAAACDDSPAADTTRAAGPATSGDPPVDDKLTVAEALASEEDGIVAVRGYVIVDANGATLCDGIAESFPPQCAEPSIALVGSTAQSLATLTVAEPNIVRDADGATWTERPVTVLGTIMGDAMIDDVITP